jgi:hypothetical protein
MTTRVSVFLLSGLALAACAETGDRFYSSIDIKSYPPADGPGEVMDPHEADATHRVIAIIEAHLSRLYPNTTIRRDAHPKSTGCVDATFTVNPDIPLIDRHGIFATPGRSYRAVIRFSNSAEDPTRPDSDPDGRGMAIKLFDLSPDQTPITVDPLAALSPAAAGAPDGRGNMSLAAQKSQDFVMISHPTFIVAEAEPYRHLVSYADADSKLAEIAMPFVSLSSMGVSGVENTLAISSLRINNPLNARYWSMVPYQLGLGADAAAIKFSARPVWDSGPPGPPDTSDPNFLRHAMAHALHERPARFSFEIQRRTSDSMSVEDPRIEWTEAEAPFHPVATITIPTQTFDTAERNEACELLSYSPWHALPDHKPLGAVNRMRKAIYEVISAFRRGGAAARSQ